MPKQIPNLRQRILAEARAALLADGYGALSVRGLAARCGVAPGTIYNYFESKDALTAAVMLQDWQQCVAQMEAFAAAPHTLTDGLAGLCALLEDYIALYRPCWRQYSGADSASYTFKYHRTLREQLVPPLAAVLAGAGRAQLVPLAPVLAETMLACARSDDLGRAAFGRLAEALTQPYKEEPHEQLSGFADRR